MTDADIICRHTHPLISDTAAVKSFLAAYSYIISPADLARLFVVRFCALPRSANFGQPPSDEEAAMHKSTQIKVLNMAKLWLDLSPLDLLERDPSGASPLDILLPFLASPITAHFANACERMRHRLLALQARGGAPKPPLIDAPPPPAAELVNPNVAEMPELLAELEPAHILAAISPREAARQLSLGIFGVYRALRKGELLRLAWTREGKRGRAAPHVRKLVKHFNGLSGLVISLVLGCEGLEQRTRVLEFFARTAVECAELHNFHCTLAIVAALQNSAVYRLKQTWAGLQPETEARATQLYALLKDNSRILRQRVESSPGPCVPYIGIYLTDLTFVEEGNPLHLQGGLINYQKVDMIGRRISEFLQWQTIPYSFISFPPIQKMFVDYSANLSPDDAHKRSLVLEPHIKEQSTSVV